MFRMPYYKKQSATLCEKYGISRFYLKLRKKIRIFNNITLRYIIIRENQVNFIVTIAYHIF